MPAVRSINNLCTLPAASEFDKVPHCSEISLCKSSQCGLPYKLFHACLVISTGSAKSADEKEAHEAHLLTSVRDSLGRARPDADPMFSSTVPVSDSSVFSDHIMSAHTILPKCHSVPFSSLGSTQTKANLLRFKS